jgi:hypothetical protein
MQPLRHQQEGPDSRAVGLVPTWDKRCPCRCLVSDSCRTEHEYMAIRATALGDEIEVRVSRERDLRDELQV